MEFPPSRFGCPSEGLSSFTDAQSEDVSPTFSHAAVAPPMPEIMAVTGCRDSDPARTTSDCHFAGKIRLVLHGVNFHTLCSVGTASSHINAACMSNFDHQFSVSVGKSQCSQVALVSQYQINCTAEGLAGVDLDVLIKRKPLSSSRGGGGSGGGGEEVMASLESAVSFKERVNYRERFGKFVEMGVGGMKREINELYRRAFASRGN